MIWSLHASRPATILANPRFRQGENAVLRTRHSRMPSGVGRGQLGSHRGQPARFLCLVPGRDWVRAVSSADDPGSNMASPSIEDGRSPMVPLDSPQLQPRGPVRVSDCADLQSAVPAVVVDLHHGKRDPANQSHRDVWVYSLIRLRRGSRNLCRWRRGVAKNMSGNRHGCRTSAVKSWAHPGIQFVQIREHPIGVTASPVAKCAVRKYHDPVVPLVDKLFTAHLQKHKLIDASTGPERELEMGTVHCFGDCGVGQMLNLHIERGLCAAKPRPPGSCSREATIASLPRSKDDWPSCCLSCEGRPVPTATVSAVLRRLEPEEAVLPWEPQTAPRRWSFHASLLRGGTGASLQ